MQDNWVDFKAIKQAVTIQQVLGRYGVKLRTSGKELRGPCPIHQGDGTASFHANTEKNAFHCFSCQAKGNVLDFVAAMEHCTIRDAALKLTQWFALRTDGERTEPRSAAAPSSVEPATAQVGERAEPNKPLGFTLRNIDHHHPYLAERGIDPETAEYFGVGFFSGKGSMSGRIVIPIENEAGQLVAYAGRSIDGSEPKYKLAAGFKKSQVIYNLARAVEESSGLVVLVEGFFDCIRVTLAGYPCVALMGCVLSDQQEGQLVAHFERVVIMLDGDEAGCRAAATIAGRLAHQAWVRVVNVPQGLQPDHLSIGQVNTLVTV